MIRPTRRGFLSGILAACAAPVVVRSGLIMPIKPSLVAAAPGAFMSAQAIANEMARELYLAGVNPISSLLPTVGAKQTFVDIGFLFSDRTATPEDFAGKFLRPAARALAQHVHHTSEPPALLRGAEECAIGERHGVKVRYVSAYDIRKDEFIHRFDVMS